MTVAESYSKQNAFQAAAQAWKNRERKKFADEADDF